MNCPGCGRFMKYLYTHNHYNGTWDLITSYWRCKKCGEQTIEHV
jgi:transposase-like protein